MQNDGEFVIFCEVQREEKQLKHCHTVAFELFVA